MAKFVLVLHPVGGAEADRALVFLLADLHAVEADVIGNDAMRQALHVEVDESFVTLTHGADT